MIGKLNRITDILRLSNPAILEIDNRIWGCRKRSLSYTRIKDVNSSLSRLDSDENIILLCTLTGTWK